MLHKQGLLLALVCCQAQIWGLAWGKTLDLFSQRRRKTRDSVKMKPGFRPFLGLTQEQVQGVHSPERAFTRVTCSQSLSIQQPKVLGTL